jgi:hypothetical protein
MTHASTRPHSSLPPFYAAQQQQAAPDTAAVAAAAAGAQASVWFQKKITLPQHKRGCHVITRKILAELPELSEYEIGLANLFSECVLCVCKLSRMGMLQQCQRNSSIAGLVKQASMFCGFRCRWYPEPHCMGVSTTVVLVALLQAAKQAHTICHIDAPAHSCRFCCC